MNRYILWKLCLPGVGLLLAGCAPRNTFQPPPPPVVTVAHPLIEDVTIYQKFPGRLEAVESVELRARVRGYLEEVRFEDGQRVEKGQVLFVIEQEPYEAALKSAKARLAQAEASRSLAKAAMERKQRAYENQAVSELDVLSAEADLEAAASAVKAEEAAVQQAELDLSYATITAPIPGRISRHRVSVGNLVGGPEETLLSKLVSEDPVYCFFNVDERSLLRLQETREAGDGGATRPGSDAPPVKLELADGSIYDLEGVIDYADTVIHATSGTLAVRARFDNPEGLLAPGMYGKILFPVERPGAMLVPELSVQRDLVGPYLLVVNEEGIVETTYVEPGPRHQDLRIILSGLNKEDQVIVKGLQRARAGIQVDTEGELSGKGN